MKRVDIVLIAIDCIMIAMIILGGIIFTDGFKTENPMNMVGGLGLMFCSWMILFYFYIFSTKDQMETEIEDLKTDLALLQNRCDWIEDDICKENKEK